MQIWCNLIKHCNITRNYCLDIRKADLVDVEFQVIVVILYDQSLHHSLHIIPHLDMDANCNFTAAWRRQTARRYSSYICISPGAGSLTFVYIYVYQQKSIWPALLQYSRDVDHQSRNRTGSNVFRYGWSSWGIQQFQLKTAWGYRGKVNFESLPKTGLIGPQNIMLILPHYWG